MRGCSSRPTNNVKSTEGNVPIRTYSQDSLKVKQQELLVVQSQATIEALQDSVERIAEKLTHVKPQYLIRYKDTVVYRERVIPLGKVDTVEGRFVRRFTAADQWYNIKIAVQDSILKIDRLELYNKVSVIIGQRGSWWQPKTIVVNVSNSNPMLEGIALNSYYYKPKERKWTIVAGPSLLFNGKQFYRGIGITAGYHIY
jgi:hypothetical protein